MQKWNGRWRRYAAPRVFCLMAACMLLTVGCGQGGNGAVLPETPSTVPSAAEEKESGTVAEVPAATTGEAEMTNTAGSIMIQREERHQTLEGFGTSGCWWSQDVGTWDAAVREQAADWLFDREKGIGLTQYRFNVGAGDINEAQDPWRRVEGFETAPGVYDYSRDAGSVAMLRLAVDRGVNDVLFFANSPPGRMLKNGKTTGDDKGESNLIPGMEAAFAQYLVDIALHFREEGIPVRHISPVNEPQWNWTLSSNGQEGCHYTPDGVIAVAKALLAELDRRGEGMTASLADSGKFWDKDYTLGLYKTFSTDEAFRGKLPHFAAHAYWSSELDKKLLATALRELGNPLPLWQSEWCQMEGGKDFGMDPALVLARCVHEDLTILDCTAWQTWIAVTRYDYKDGLLHADPATKTVTDMKRLWALGNWSRFVRPGHVRIGATSPTDNLLVSAWLSPQDGQTVLVVVNESTEVIAADLPEASGYTAWETSETKDLAQVSMGSGSSYAFPARSITTVVME